MEQRTTDAWDDEIDLFELISVLFRRRVLILGLVLIAVLTAAALSYLVLPEKYESSGSFAISNGFGNGRHGMNSDRDFGQADLGMSLSAYQVFATSDRVLRNLDRQVGTSLKLEELRDVFDVQLDDRSRLLRVTATAASGREAQRLLTAWHTAFNEEVLLYVAQQLTQRLQVADQRVTSLAASFERDGATSLTPSVKRDDAGAPEAVDTLDEMSLLQLSINSAYGERLIEARAERDVLTAIKDHLDDQTPAQAFVGPTIPDAPAAPRKLLNMAIAGFLAAFVGVGIAFVQESWGARRQLRADSSQIHESTPTSDHKESVQKASESW